MPQPEQGSPEARPQTPSPDGVRPGTSSEVERYVDETPLGHAPATVVRSTVAHTAPEGGRAVTLLVGGTYLSQLAERDGSILVAFSDPADPSREEMGWIDASALRPARRGRCAAPEVTVVTALGSICAKPCRDARGCGADEACVPAGTPVAHAGRITNAFSYCVGR